MVLEFLRNRLNTYKYVLKYLSQIDFYRSSHLVPTRNRHAKKIKYLLRTISTLNTIKCLLQKTMCNFKL